MSLDSQKGNPLCNNIFLLHNSITARLLALLYLSTNFCLCILCMVGSRFKIPLPVKAATSVDKIKNNLWFVFSISYFTIINIYSLCIGTWN